MSRNLNTTKSIGEAVKTVRTEFFRKRENYEQKLRTLIPVWDVWFPFLPLESIQSHSPGLYALYKNRAQIFGNFRCPTMGKPVRRCAAWLTDM